jgi:hypothetical protein
LKHRTGWIDRHRSLEMVLCQFNTLLSQVNCAYII